MRVAIFAAVALLACGCGSDEGPTSPTRSTADHLVIVRVLNAQSGAPLTDISVTVLDGPRAGTIATSPSDQVPLQLPAADMTLRITAQGFHPVDRAVRVDAPMVIEVRADRVVFSLSGAVRDVSSGGGLADAEVEIVQGEETGRRFRTQSDGLYRIDQLLPGTKRVRFRAEGYIEQTVQVSLTDNQSIDIALSELFLLAGFVTDIRSTPLAGVRVRGELGDTLTDASGRFEFRSTANSVRLSRLEPPSGYEPTSNTLNGAVLAVQAGRHNTFAVKRILTLTIRSFSQMCIGEGRRNVNPVVTYDTGDVVQLAGTRNYDVRPVSSNPEVLRASVGGSGDGAYVEPLAPGTATVTATYWGVASPPVSVRVVRC